MNEGLPLKHAMRPNATDLRLRTNIFVNHMPSTIHGINFSLFGFHTLGYVNAEPPLIHAVRENAIGLRRRTNILVNCMPSSIDGINFSLIGLTYPRVCERRAPLKPPREGKRNRFEKSDKGFRKWHAKHYLWYKFQPFRAHIP